VKTNIFHDPRVYPNQRVDLSALLFSTNTFSSLWYQIPQRQIIHNILNLLDTIFDAITSPPQGIILEIQNLKASVDVLDELTDLKWSLVISQCDTIDG